MPMTAPRKSEHKEQMTRYNLVPTAQGTDIQGNYEWRGKEQRECVYVNYIEVGRATPETQD